MGEEHLKIHLEDYNKPIICDVCGGRMVFKGVGEYQCENCGNLEYDDYGKVRTYIETHPHERMMSDVEKNTGVSRKVIRQMLREERIEIAADSTIFLQCEICKKSIRSGRYCPECAKKVRAQEEMEKAKKGHRNTLQGFGHKQREEEGEKRFHRER